MSISSPGSLDARQSLRGLIGQEEANFEVGPTLSEPLRVSPGFDNQAG